MRLARPIIVLMILTLFLLPASAVGAAPETADLAQTAVSFAEGAQGFNPPGWVGGLLAVLAIALPIAFRFWVRQK